MTFSKEAIYRAIFDPGATEGYKGERTLTEWQTDAVMRVLSTLPIAVEGKVKELVKAAKAAQERMLVEGYSLPEFDSAIAAFDGGDDV